MSGGAARAGAGLRWAGEVREARIPTGEAGERLAGWLESSVSRDADGVLGTARTRNKDDVPDSEED